MQEFNTEYIQPQPTQKVEDPIVTMFKNVKRIKEFSISLEIKNKIPRPDFIEMMEDSYNTSIIDFLAAEFTDNILKNPHLIEDMIRQKIKEVVYGVEVKQSEEKISDKVFTKERTTRSRPTSTKITEINKSTSTKDTESILIIPKKTPTRKTRVKKEVSNND